MNHLPNVPRVLTRLPTELKKLSRSVINGPKCANEYHHNVQKNINSGSVRMYSQNAMFLNDKINLGNKVFQTLNSHLHSLIRLGLNLFTTPLTKVATLEKKYARSTHDSTDDFIDIYNESGDINNIDYVNEHKENERDFIERSVYSTFDDFIDAYKDNGDINKPEYNNVDEDDEDPPLINPDVRSMYRNNYVDNFSNAPQENCNCNNTQYYNDCNNTTVMNPYAGSMFPNNNFNYFTNMYQENYPMNNLQNNYLHEKEGILINRSENKYVKDSVIHPCAHNYVDYYNNYGWSNKIQSNDVNTSNDFAKLPQENCNFINTQNYEGLNDTTVTNPHTRSMFANNNIYNFKNMCQQHCTLNNLQCNDEEATIINTGENVKEAVINPCAYNVVDCYKDDSSFNKIQSNEVKRDIEETYTTDDLKENDASKTKLLSLEEVKEALHKTQFENVVENLRRTRPQEKDQGKILTKEEKERLNYAYLCRVYQLNIPGRDNSSVKDPELPQIPSYMKPKQPPRRT